MASAVCPPGAICSDVIVTPIDGKPYYTVSSTKVTQGSDGKVNGGETSILYSQKPNVYIPAATTKDGGKTWTYAKYKQGDDIPDGKKVGDEIFGNQAKKSLEGGALKTNTNQQVKTAATKASIPPEQQKPLTLNQNTASPTGDPPVAGTTGNATQEQFQQIANAAKSYKGRKEYPKDLRYPINMNENQDCIQFKIIEYTPSKLGLTESEDIKLRTTFGTRNALSTITLPMPSGGITDRNSASWQSGELNAAQDALAGVAMNLILGGPAAGTDVAKKELEKATAGNKDLIKAIIAAKSTETAIGTNNLLSRAFGVQINQNLELLFDGPQLRDFSFSFKMTPRSKLEAIRVRSIIRTFKQAMSVKRSESVLLLKAPHTFRISYLTSNKSHPYLNRFKECALTGCSVNYTPDNSYMSYDDSDPDGRSMTAYELTLSFNELEPIFDDDYENMEGAKGSFNHIGY